ncbi:LysM peptidoglycan-binding domain-containing protein [Pseudonocardia sediminis]|uniref:LysM peptidoglycan-binding domain-containing protein n=1 Tax=Pseudonocardia sediminis TaxID=1397368 RepID=UPI001A91F6C0|nr:LysM peptidoglycan-binding domain-containing protein [Pseudonocardia sediminis]
MVAAAVWFVLAVSIIRELVAALAHRPTPRIPVPGFRVGGLVAGALVAMLLGTGPALAAPAAMATTIASVQPLKPPPIVDVAVADGPVHVVAPRDTLWRIAETSLGDPLRWREIYELNAGRVQADGGRLTEGSVLTVGWRLVMPTDAADSIRVGPGDTLTALAAEHLGDPARADELFAANSGIPQPGGARLENPNQLRPGWTLTLPSPGPATGVTPTPSPPDTTPPSNAPMTTRAPRPEPVPATSPPAPSPAVTPQAPRSAEPAPAPETANSPDATTVIAAAGISTLLAGGVVAALLIRRRRQLRYRPARHKISVPPSDAAGRIEWSATTAPPATGALELDLALRSLAHPDRGQLVPPQLRTVRTDLSGARLSLRSSMPAPDPFTDAGDLQWRLDAAAALPAPEEEVSGCCSPFPALITVATADGDARRLLVELEGRSVLSIGGDRRRVVALLRHVAAELATNRTAEDAEIILVGLDDELLTLNPEQMLQAPDLSAALTEIGQRARATRSELDRHQMASAVDGRLRDVAADSWLPTVLLSASEPSDEERHRLRDLMASGAGDAAVSVVVFDPDETAAQVLPDGVLVLPDGDDGPWWAVQLTENAGTHLSSLFGAADEPAMPVEAASHAEPWSEGMNEDGSLTDGLPDDGDEPDGDDVPDEVPNSHPELPDSVSPPRPPAAPDALRRLAMVEHQDPDLDDDLVAWHDQDTPSRPMIAVLGEPSVRAPGPLPTARPSWFAEVLVYLNLHPAGVTAAKAVTDLWPDGQRISPATIRHAFYGARRWAGRGLGGDPAVTFVSDMQTDSTYRLRGHLSDWDLFRRLRKRGQARHAAGREDGVDDYRDALALIRGPVLSALRPGGYAWLNNHDQRHDLQIPGFIVDTAHELVDIALAGGDTALARHAAEQARVVDIDVAFDQPLTDLMRVAHAEDNRAELELHASVLLDARGFEVPEELAPDSFAVLNELIPAGPIRTSRS